MLETVYIALGSNLADPIQQLQSAVKNLQTLPESEFITVSSFYSSKPLGPQDQPDYINAVACIKTSLSPLTLLDHLQSIENKQGRVRKRRWGERTLDLDILLYGQQMINNDRLIIPHYDMKNRSFVLIPLQEIAPQLILPCGDSIAKLAEKITDNELYKLNLI